ncbi:MAG: NAD(P)H-hydrate epimerase [Evtepia gabavorous]
MKDVITVATMRESDAHTIALYVPSRELMYRAAMGVYQAVNWQGKKVAIFTGSGNNGGDGYALAGILADHSVPCCLYQVSEHYSEDGKYYYDQAVEKGVERKRFSEGEDLSRYDILVDCLLGTGFSGPVRGAFQQAIQAINRAKAYVVRCGYQQRYRMGNRERGPGGQVSPHGDHRLSESWYILGGCMVGRLVVADRVAWSGGFLPPAAGNGLSAVCLFRAAKLR